MSSIVKRVQITQKRCSSAARNLAQKRFRKLNLIALKSLILFSLRKRFWARFRAALEHRFCVICTRLTIEDIKNVHHAASQPRVGVGREGGADAVASSGQIR